MTGIWLIAFITLWVLFLAVAFALLVVLRNFGALYDTLARLQSGQPAPLKLEPDQALPDTPLLTLDSAPQSVAEFAGAPTAFTVVSPQCGPCRDLLLTIAAGRDSLESLQPAARRVLISLGDAAATRAALREAGLPEDLPILLDTQGQLQQRWGVTNTPTTVVVRADLTFVRHEVGFTPPPPPTGPVTIPLAQSRAA
ncbi:MAG TPA: hypothetical protein VFS21_23225 [Roseiflexaceae bacterium]|nr:hypothetical protein [Roseiflexaceae bacterium]